MERHTQKSRTTFFETLEIRRLLAAVVWNANGAIDVSGSDSIVVTQNYGSAVYTLNVTINGTSAGSFPLSGSDTFQIDSGAGNDTVDATAVSVATILNGGDGDDSLLGGANADTVNAGAGDDTLFGSDGNDNLGGEDGIDYIEGGLGSDSMHGGAGDDLMLGGKGNDTIIGSFGSDNISAGDGNDTVTFSYLYDPGYDTILGGQGNDLIQVNSTSGGIAQAGAGNDTLYAMSGNCALYGNEGDDTFYAANDKVDVAIRGGDGYDWAQADKRDTGPGVIDSISYLTFT